MALSWVRPQVGTKLKRLKVESSKWKVERKNSSLTHFPPSTFHCFLIPERHLAGLDRFLIPERHLAGLDRFLIPERHLAGLDRSLLKNP